MKKLIFIILLFIPFIVYADDFSLSLSCPDSASYNNVISCEIRGNAPDNVINISGKFELGGASYEEFDFSEKLTKVSLDSKGFNLKNDNGIKYAFGTNNFIIGLLRVKAPSDGSTFTIKITNITAKSGDEEEKKYTSKNLSSKIKLKSTSISLSSISVDSYELVPTFNNDVASYKVNVDTAERVNINASSSDSAVTIDGLGEKELKYGYNIFELTAKNSAGETKTYKLIVNKKDTRDLTNTLKNLVVAGYDFDKKFDSKETKYSTTVDSINSKIAIKAELTSNKASFVKNYGPRTVKLKYGDNKYQIKVQAENGTIRVYTVNIHRIDDRDTNNDLGSLKISNGHYSFDKATTSYIINVLYDVSTLGVEPKCDSDKASLEVFVGNEKTKVSEPYNISLNVGNNKFKIIVTAENETTKEYNFTVNRLKEGTKIEDVENVDYLSSLDINGKSANFSSKVEEYTVEIAGEETLEFSYELSPGASGTIELKDDTMGQIKLVEGNKTITISPVIDGSIIYMNLESAEGYAKKFTFNVKRADYYVGHVDDAKIINVKWDYKFIIGLVSFIILIGELISFGVIAVKNGGVENKTDEFQKSLKGGLSGIKNFKFPSKKPKEEKKEEKTQGK